MEFHLLISVFFILFSLHMLFKLYVRTSKTQKLPPGPWKLPLVGSIHHLLGKLPHHALRDLSNVYGPIIHLQLGEVPTVVVSSSEWAKEVMKTHDLVFASRPKLLVTQVVFYGTSDFAFAPYGDYWRQMRKICTLELLSIKNVRSFAPIRREESARLIASVHRSSSSGQPINLSERLLAYSNAVIYRAAFGKASKTHGALITAINQTVELMGGFDVADIFPSMKWLHFVCGAKTKLLKIHKKMDEFLDQVIDEHKKNQTSTNRSDDGCEEDLVDALSRIKEEGDFDIPITNDNIKAVILDMFIAGTETSASVVEWAMSEMMRNPEVMKNAQNEVRQSFKGKTKIHEDDIQDLKYLNLIIKETLRLHPPVPLLGPRESLENSNINGYYIPAKTKVLVNCWAIGRDPQYWQDPEKFQPERFDKNVFDFKGNNFEFIPFGAGRRICPGSSFGLANVELNLALLLYHFNWKLLDGVKPEELDMSDSSGLTARRKNQLYLIATTNYPFPGDFNSTEKKVKGS